MNRIKELREERDITQQELASVVDVTKWTIRRWERGESQIKQSKVVELCDFFDVSAGYLLGYDDHAKPTEFQKRKLIAKISEFKKYNLLRFGNKNFIAEDDVLAVIDEYL